MIFKTDGKMAIKSTCMGEYKWMIAIVMVYTQVVNNCTPNKPLWQIQKSRISILNIEPATILYRKFVADYFTPYSTLFIQVHYLYVIVQVFARFGKISGRV